MIAITFDKMKDDQTLGQFKSLVKKQLQDTIGFDGEVGHIERCWEDR